MVAQIVGEVCALMSALIWAFALVLFKLSGRHLPPLSLNLFKNCVALALLVATLLVLRDGWSNISHFAWKDIAILLLSGMLGIALADTLLFYSLNLLGVGLLAIVECLYSPFVILFSSILLDEELTARHYVGGGLVVAAVFMCSRHDVPSKRSRFELMLGLLLGAAAMGFMALGIVMAKPVLDERNFPLIWAATIRLFAGTLILILLTLVSAQRKQHWSVFRPSPIWKLSIPAGVLGTYMSMVLWVAGFKYAKAAVAGILNQTTCIFAIILATIILREPFTRRKLLAIALAMGGVLTVTLLGR